MVAANSAHIYAYFSNSMQLNLLIFAAKFYEYVSTVVDYVMLHKEDMA